jgi:carboxyl-terminal processing protease
MSRPVKLAVLGISLLVLFYVAFGYVLGKTTDDRTYRALTVFTEVLQHIQQDYVEEPNLQLVASGALHGLLESLDAQSSYIGPRDYAEYKKYSQNGGKSDIGAVLSKRFGYIVVVSALPDSPAYKAGLRNGDILEAIAGFSTRDISIGQARMLLSGEPGTPVKVSVVSRRLSSTGQAQDVEVIRRKVAFPPVMADRIEGDVGYLRVPALNQGKSGEIRQKLAQFDRQGTRKLVLDLRDCAAGEIQEAVETARLFVPSGTLTTLRGQTVTAKEFAADPAKLVWKQSVTVLISNGTSGPAEVLAAALGGNPGAWGGKVEIIGERTFGTASEQKLIPLDDGAALVLTVANYYTPSGKSIHDEGVSPTVAVRDSTDLADLEEPDRSAPSAPSAPEVAAPAAAGKPSRDDPILKKALELLQAPGKAENKPQIHLQSGANLQGPAA